MDKIKIVRYGFIEGTYGDFEAMENGDYVDFDDYSSIETRLNYVEAERDALKAQRDELLKDLQAMEHLIDKPECSGLDRPTDFAISHDRGMRIASIQSAIKKSIAKCEVQNDEQ